MTRDVVPSFGLVSGTLSARVRGWSLLAVWSFLALASIGQVALVLHTRGQPIVWSQLVPDRLIDWFTCAMFTPVCIWLARVRPLTRPHLLQTLALYVAVTALCVVAKCVIMVLLLHVIPHGRAVTIVEALVQGALFDGVMLWAIIVLVHALDLQQRVADRDRSALDLRARLSEAELEALRGQLQPHFLFNTLNGIASLIHTAPDAADRLVVRLSDLLRAALAHRGTVELPLSDELALLDTYLSIMAERFAGQFSVVQEIDRDAQNVPVPQFLLQPLVENAFEHGFSRRAGTGRITIRARRSRVDRLQIEVRDDGIGPHIAAPMLEGVGLGGTRRRLQRLYGDDQSLTLRAADGGGALVTIELPIVGI